MSSHRPLTSLRRAAALGVLAWLAVRAGAESTPASPPPTDDSIAAAKRDLDALKALTNNAAAGVTRGSGPQLSVPSLQMPTEPAPVAPTLTDPQKLNEKAGTNWLVDAMMKPDPTRRGSARTGTLTDSAQDPRNADPRSTDSRGLDPTRDAARDDRNARDAGQGRDGPRDPADRTSAKPDVVANPLNRYMADWMSPQDYTLLRRTIESAADKNGGLSSLGSAPTAPGSGSGSSPDLSALAGIQIPGDEPIAAGKPAYAPATPPVNPYLQALTEPPPTTSFAPPPAPTQAPAFTPAPPPPAIEPAKPLIPDFAKPSNDDKYFKPLKRF